MLSELLECLVGLLYGGGELSTEWRRGRIAVLAIMVAVVAIALVLVL